MSNVLRHAAVVGAMTGISRLGGLVREQLMAYYFGTGLAKSAFDVAFRLPNLFRRLFGEGALSAAFIPVYTETRAREEEAANRFVGQVAGLLLAVLGGVAGLGILVVLAVERWVPLAERWGAILPMLRIMLPYAPLICLGALAMGVLNALKHFALPALAPVFLNLIWIVTLVGVCPLLPADPFVRVHAVAWAIVFAGLVQVAFQLPALARCGVPLRLSCRWRGDARIARVIRLMAPMALGAGVIQVNVCIDGFLAMWAQAPWGPAALEYAERLVYLPMGIVGNAFATVLLPAFSSQAVAADHGGLRDTLERALRNIAMIMAPAAIALTVLALPTVELVYRLGKGAFQAESAVYTARALAGYAPGLLVFSFYKAITPAFYALQDTRTPTRVAITGVLLNLALNILFVLTWPSGWKHMGLAVATVLTSLINCVTLACILGRRIGGPRISQLAPTYVGAIGAAVVMGAVAYGVQGWVLVWARSAMTGKLAEVLAMLAAIGVGGVVYAGATWLLCRPALRELADDVRHRRRPARGEVR